jgi:hypothetical protein
MENGTVRHGIVDKIGLPTVFRLFKEAWNRRKLSSNYYFQEAYILSALKNKFIILKSFTTIKSLNCLIIF